MTRLSRAATARARPRAGRITSKNHGGNRACATCSRRGGDDATEVYNKFKTWRAIDEALHTNRKALSRGIGALNKMVDNARSKLSALGEEYDERRLNADLKYDGDMMDEVCKATKGIKEMEGKGQQA